MKFLAEYLDLSPATISVVLNDSPTAREIPAVTRERVLAAARKFNYRPNVLARSLRQRRSFTVGVLVHEISEGYGALLLNGIDAGLLQEGYFYFVASHRRREDLLDEYPRVLMGRSVEGFIAIDTLLKKSLPLPAVNISGHTKLSGVTNLVLDERLAARLALEHLTSLGHESIAFIKGQPFSSDSQVRWESTRAVARELRIEIRPELTVQLENDSFSPMVGYPLVRELLSRTTDFTALYAYNDLSAIGAIRAIRERGLRVPEDISVVGFDDILSAAFQNPSLTTIRQPLREMGMRAARILVDRLLGETLLYAQQNDPIGDGRVRQAYFVDQPDTNGVYLRPALAPFFFVGSATGDMSRVGMALAHLFARTGERQLLNNAAESDFCMARGNGTCRRRAASAQPARRARSSRLQRRSQHCELSAAEYPGRPGNPGGGPELRRKAATARNGSRRRLERVEYRVRLLLQTVSAHRRNRMVCHRGAGSQSISNPWGVTSPELGKPAEAASSGMTPPL